MTLHDPSTRPAAGGIIFAPLTERHADRIVLGAYALLFLPEGVLCDFPLGTLLEVTYTEREARRIAGTISPARTSGAAG